MSLKLGELLINEGIITQDQLDEALKCHVIFGVKLGSSLIELGFVREDVLLNLLSRKLGVPAVTHEALFNVTGEVIARLSPAVAAKFRVVPIKLENKRLYVAMSDPTDLKAQEELAFISGLIIVPNIAPELQILYALEKYYNFKLDHRYVSASCELKRRRSYNKVDESAGFVTDESKYTISDDIERTAGLGGMTGVQIPGSLTAVTAVDEPEPRKQSNRETIELYTIDKLSLDFSNAKNSDDVADIFIRYLGQEFSRCALMTIRGTMAIGWRAASGGRLVKDFGQMAIDLSHSPELAEILSDKQYFSGPLTNLPANLPLMQALDISNFSSILALPVIMNDRVVSMIVVSADTVSLQRRLDDLQKLAYKASLTFQILVLKNKLLQT
jgi:Type II secretion system (T2SS), protein E, N-terminal domain